MSWGRRAWRYRRGKVALALIGARPFVIMTCVDEGSAVLQEWQILPVGFAPDNSKSTMHSMPVYVKTERRTSAARQTLK